MDKAYTRGLARFILDDDRVVATASRRTDKRREWEIDVEIEVTEEDEGAARYLAERVLAEIVGRWEQQDPDDLADDDDIGLVLTVARAGSLAALPSKSKSKKSGTRPPKRPRRDPVADPRSFTEEGYLLFCRALAAKEQAEREAEQERYDPPLESDPLVLAARRERHEAEDE